MAYGSMPYVRDGTKKKVAAHYKCTNDTFKVSALINSHYEPYQSLWSTSMGNRTVNWAWKLTSLKYRTSKSLKRANRRSSDFFPLYEDSIIMAKVITMIQTWKISGYCTHHVITILKERLELVGSFQVALHLCLSVYAILFDCYTLFVASTAPGSLTEHVAYSDIDIKEGSSWHKVREDCNR